MHHNKNYGALEFKVCVQIILLIFPHPQFVNFCNDSLKFKIIMPLYTLERNGNSKMTDSIDYSSWKGMKAIIARLADANQDGKLEKTDKFDEISIFNQKYAKAMEFENDLKEKFTIAEQDAIKSYEPKILDKFYIQQKTEEKETDAPQNPEVTKMITNEARKRGVDINNIDIDYWTEKISDAAEKYNIPEVLLIAIIGQETNGKFTKNINSSTGAGPMQITGITVKDFFPSKGNGWTNIYKNMNEKLLNDILYKKDKNGNFIKDRKGDYVLKYPTPKALRDACTKDDELGIKVGLLCFEMKYVKAVAQKKYGKATYANIPKVIEGIKSGEITLNENENKNVIKTALKNYNSVFNSYAATVIDSLATHGLNFKDLYFIK